MNERMLALGGGGSKGMFQMGAWKAFRELGVEFTAISGTSIGAVNGALMLGADYEAALEMWDNLTIDQCLAFTQPAVSTPKSEDLLTLKNANLLARELLSHKALNTEPLRELLSHYIDEKRIRASGVNLGIMTTEMPNLKGKAVWLEQIPQGQLIDYVMASARLPGLAPVTIDGKTYMDGGIIENVPISMLRRLGCRRIVAVDLESKASILSHFDDNVQMTLIHDKEDLGGFLDLTPTVLQNNFQLGYLDTMKAFAKLNGEYYSFTNAEYSELLARFGIDTVNGLEKAARIYEIDRTSIYTAEEFIHHIREKRIQVQQEYEGKRKKLKIEHKLAALAKGTLRVLDLLPALRLAFLLEIKAQAKEEGSSTPLPLRLFSTVDAAADALNEIEGKY